MTIRTFCLSLSVLLASSAAARAQEALPPATSDMATPVPVPMELLQVKPGGLTADQAAARAAATSWNARAAQDNLAGAAARLDQAWAAFLPRLTGTGRYSRLSDLTPPTFGGGSLVGSTAPPGTVFTPANLQGGQYFFAAVGLSFPLVLDNWLMQASITVPLSDYLLRINQSYTAATHSQDAARWDLASARAKSASDGRVAYYTWLRARGAVVVATQALDDQKTHLRDARNQFAAGNASKADVLRAETAVAAADLALERARNLAELTDKQLRVAVHARDDETLSPGEDLESAPPPVAGSRKQMTAEALAARPEVKSADANAAATHDQAQAARAGRWPSVSAFADGIYANPNPRRFPQQNEWFPTWDVGAQLVWSPNDVLLANGATADIESRAAAIEAGAHALRDGIEVEVTQAWQAVREADFAIESSARELASAQEAYRVARELFNNGRGTSTTLTDAETELTRSRLDGLNAKVDARVARIRLDHALGRDAHAPQ